MALDFTPESLIQALSSANAAPAPAPKPNIKAALTDFTSNLMFTLGESLKASAQYPGARGTRAGQGAALQAPMILQQMRQQEEQRKAQERIAAEDRQRKIASEGFDQFVKGANLRLAQAAEDRLSAPKPPEAAPLPAASIQEYNTWKAQQPLGAPSSYEDFLAKKEAITQPKTPAPVNYDQRFKDLAIAEAIAKNGGQPLSRIEEKTTILEAEAELSKAGRQDNSEMQELRLRQAELSVQLAEQRLNATKQSGLSSQQQTQVLREGARFDSNDLTKKYNKVQEATQFATTMDPKSKNSADHIAMIYAFAKAMDPESVVREGEYDTVKKYAQSWLAMTGFNLQSIIDNKGFLSEQAIRNMQKTIEAKSKPVVQQYQNYRKETIRKLNVITGNDDGEKYIIDYGGAFTEAPAAPAGGTVEWIRGADGKPVRK